MDTNHTVIVMRAWDRTGGLDLIGSLITNQLLVRMCTNIQYRYHGDNSTDTMVTEFLELTSYLILILLGLYFFCGDFLPLARVVSQPLVAE